MTYSIIQKSQLEGASRLDAEYYQPEYLAMAKTLTSSSGLMLGEIAFITDGEHGSPAYDEDSGIKYYSGQFIEDGYLLHEGMHCIDKRIDEKNKRSRLAEGSILLSIVGTVGKAGIVQKENLPGNTDRNVATIKITNKKYSPKFITPYLLSRYGTFQTEREVAGNVQPIMILYKVRDIVIPDINTSAQIEVSELFDKYLALVRNAETLYSQAEQLLLEELGLEDTQFGEDLAYSVKFSDVKTAGRMDADYFQPKYEKLMEQVASHGGRPLGEIVSVKKGVEPGAEAYRDEGKLFIRVSSISKQGVTDKDQKYLGEKLYKELKETYQPRVGEILLTKDASPGMAYVLKEPIEGIVSGGVLRLKAKEDIGPEYIALCINSSVGQMQVERDAGGSVIAHWKPEQVKSMLIPILPKPIQQKIADLVRQSYEARKKSKELLESAKHKVEELIESGERRH